ncbi:MAG: phage tail tape measure protein [Pseudomonadota bacterium]
MVDTPDDRDMAAEINAGRANFYAALKNASKQLAEFGTTLSKDLLSIAVLGRDASASLKTLGESFKRLMLNISDSILKAAFKPLETAVSNSLTSMSGSLFKFANGGVIGQEMPMLFGRGGGVISQGMPVPFARGGVVSAPSLFPLSGAQTGLMGESGPEAILPLARGVDGNLGVRAGSGAGGMNVTFNVTATDVDSFRRSESQLASMLNRMVAQGERNL